METSKERLQEIIKEYSTLDPNSDELITEVVSSIKGKIETIARMGHPYEESSLIHGELTSRHKENLIMFEYSRYKKYISQYNLDPLPYVMFKNPKNILVNQKFRCCYNSIKNTDITVGMEVYFRNTVTHVTRINRDCSVSINGFRGSHSAFDITPCEYDEDGNLLKREDSLAY